MSAPLIGKRIVLKVGSALLVGPDAAVRAAWLAALAGEIEALLADGRQVIVVTSGAIALGRGILALPGGALRLEEKQAAAAVGQIALAAAWGEALGARGRRIAQILLTLDDTEHRRRYLNARSTVETLLRLGAVPVVNENDTVATTEIRIGDNDRLSARVAVMASADTLVLLSDVDGLYTADPRRDPAASHLAEVKEITAEIEAMAGGAGTRVGTGGMLTKLAAAKIATRAGCRVVLARGTEPAPLTALAAGARHTVFPAQTNPRRARKDWLAASLGASGVLTVDDGAATALRAGRSLLPAGVVAVEGRFEKGDAVLVRTRDGLDLAKGLVAYDAADAQKLVGRRTEEIEPILGWRGRDELIHRDDLVLL